MEEKAMIYLYIYEINNMIIIMFWKCIDCFNFTFYRYLSHIYIPNKAQIPSILTDKNAWTRSAFMDANGLPFTIMV